MTIKERIKALCKEQGISLNKLEQECGFAKGYLSKLDKTNPSMKYLTKIAERLNVSTDYLMTGKEEEVDYYYIDKDTRELVDFIHKHPEHKVLMDASRKVKIDDIDKALRIIGLFTDEN